MPEALGRRDVARCLTSRRRRRASVGRRRVTAPFRRRRCRPALQRMDGADCGVTSHRQDTTQPVCGSYGIVQPWKEDFRQDDSEAHASRMTAGRWLAGMLHCDVR